MDICYNNDMVKQEFCPNCETYQATSIIKRDETYMMQNDPLGITAEVETKVCNACGETICTDADDQAVIDRVYKLGDRKIMPDGTVAIWVKNASA